MRSLKKALPSLSEQDRVDLLITCTAPLLELFATVDDVFGEEDAFAPAKLYSGLGRIYRAWKAAREAIDPDFDPQRWIHEEGEQEP